ncbi:small subunit processome component [Canna indica]|uniref:Small subunit processome component n=1 Tax=Canna indica TaxID=4628 RepID=A0AAQ3K013_9LILI|nr:small subunit processome component [Canna indica]
MAQPERVKSLNTSAGRRRFVFKTFSQRLEEIDINVYRSLDLVKAQPSDGSSFLRESLVCWREMNTAEDFISFYEEMMPLVQTLPQVILHKETIMSKLLDRLNMKARLSLEPILMLIAALSRDLLDEFLPFLQKLVNSLVDLLKNGGHHDPEILEQVFTSWSYIMMYLQKYLVRDVVSVLKITVKIRFFPKDYVQEFMAEAVSFLLRNACNSQLCKGVRKVIREVAKSSSVKRTGVTALLCHVMRGASSRLHSRAETVWQLMIDKTIFRIGEKYTEGPDALLEVSTGIISRLCSEIDPKELKVIFHCLFKEIFCCVGDGYLEHLNHLLSLLTFAVRNIDGSKVYDRQVMLDLVSSLIQSFVVPSIGAKTEDIPSKVLSRLLELMLCLLDVPLISVDLSNVLQLYAPIFKLEISSLLSFVRGLILKDPQIVHLFKSHILSAMDELIEASPEEVLFLMLTFIERQSKLQTCDIVGVSEDTVPKICNFLRERIFYWINLFRDIAGSSDVSHKQFTESEMALLWGVVSCYHCFPFLQDSLVLFKDLIGTIDHLLETEADKIADVPTSTWQSIIGAALSSYHKLLIMKKFEASEASTFLHLAKRHKSSLPVLSAVAEYMDSIFGSKDEGESNQNIFQEVQDVTESMSLFGNNLILPNKAIRMSSLRILSHYAPLAETLPKSDVRPHKKLKTEGSGANTEVFQSINVIELLLSVEMTPLSISTSRKIVVLLSKLHTNLSSGRISDVYIPLLLNGIIGILHNRFSHVWDSALECLTILIGRYKELVWNSFVQYLDSFQSKFLCSGDHIVKPNSGDPQPNDLVGCFNLFLDPDFDCTPCTMITVLLLQSLQKIPDIAESRSRQLIPLFLKFLGYGSGDCFSVESYVSYTCKRMDWKMILKEWLNLLVQMRNAQSLYRSPVLKEVLVKRLLDEVDQDIQLKTLDCLLNWKDDFMVSYGKHLKNMIVTKSLREELTTWSVSVESEFIQEEHRPHLIPIIIGLLTPKVRKLKTLGSRKHAGLSHRKAVLCFLAQLEVHELELFFLLLLKPLIPKDLANEFFDIRTQELAGVLTDGSESSILVKCSFSINIANLSWKKKNGFVHVVEEILRTFDEAHIKLYLNPLLMIVVRILENCMLNLVSERGNKVCGLEDSSGPSANTETTNAALDASSMTAKQLKDLRSLCLKVISFVLNKYESHDFRSDFWDIFFLSVKPLIDSFKYEGSSSEKPSSLLSCFVSMSRNPILVSLLEREANLVPTIFSMLTVRTASDAIISSILHFIENLLNMDTSVDHQENECVKRILVPNLDVLIQSFHGLLQSRKEIHRKCTKWPGNTELRIFKLLVRYITDPVVAGRFVDILLPFFKKKDRSPDEILEGLHVLRGILPVVRIESSGRIIEAIHPLLVSSGLELRLCICDVVDGLVLIDPSLAEVARPLHELNAVSSSISGELDYDTRMKAYNTIGPELFSKLKVEHAMLILSHCVYDMASEELIFRQSASRALLSFIDFAALVLNNIEDNSSEMLLDDAAQEISTSQILEKREGTYKWTKSCIKQIINTTFLHNIGDAMTKDISVQKGWIDLLRSMVYHLHGLPYLNLFRPLCSEDPEVDFFNNILHLQIHRRKRALSRFRNVLGSGNFAENIIVKIFLPLFFNMVIDVQEGKGEDLRNASLETLAFISSYMRWDSYRTFLMRCFREMTRKPDKQKILLRLICAILDVFHFSSVDNTEVVKNGTEVSAFVDAKMESVNALPSSESNTKISSEIQSYLQNIFLPQIRKLLTSDTEKVNVNISLAAIKVLKLLPVDIMESQLSSIIHRICIFLKNRLESIRDEARSALAACLKELGLEYLQFIVKVLQAILKRGYELHVLGYTLNFILTKTLVNAAVGKLDYCMNELLSVVENDILGDVAQEKEVDKIASKMKETRKKKSFETLKLISQSITFRTHAMKLLSPINTHLSKHITPKMKGSLEMMLQHIALGIECNSSVKPSELLVYVYGLIEDNISPDGTHHNVLNPNGLNKKSGHEMTQKRDTSNHCKFESHNSHLIVVFALGLLHNYLKNMKLNKEDEQLLSMLDPFVRLMGNCLSSKYEDVLAAAFRCFTPLVRLPLPSLQAHGDNIKILLLEIAQKSGNAGSPLVQSCLKLLTVLLRSTKISISDDQLHMLIQFPVFIDLQTKPSPVALSLLKSIVDRKLVVHEIYDIVMQVAELMVTSQSEPIRKKSSKVLLQFLLDYRLSDKRLQQHMDFLLANLSYEHSSGREAVLEMLHAILVKFPKSVIDNQAQSFFLHLVVALANEHDHKLRAMVATAIKVLLNHTSQNAMRPILGYTLSWYMGEKRHLWSASAEVLGLLVEVMVKGFQEHVNSVLNVARGILESSIHAASNEGFDNLKEAAIPLWKEAYYSLIMLEKMLQYFPELYFDTNLEELWVLICKLLLHPHIWVRNISSRLVASYFLSVTEASRIDNQKLKSGSCFLVNPSRLFAIAVSCLNQLKTHLIDDTASNLITQNLVFAACSLHTKLTNSLGPYEYWSTLDSRKKGVYLEAFDNLGSKKARDTFLLSTTVRSDSSAIDDQTEEGNRDVRSLLVVPLIKRMGKIAMQMEDIQMRIVFNSFRMISLQIGSEGSRAYAIHMVTPLYKVCEGFAGKVVSDEIKQLAEEVRDSLRDVLGVDSFVHYYNLIRKNLKQKREKRRQQEKLIAVINPMRHAKRKLRVAEKHRVHKRRKIMTMKMGRGRR